MSGHRARLTSETVTKRDPRSLAPGRVWPAETSPRLFAELSDGDLLTRIASLARTQRRVSALLVAALAEMDRRRLHLAHGCSSLFTYCTDVLRMSRYAAYNRILAARLVARFPLVLHHLEAGTLTLSTARLLAPILTVENHVTLLGTAAGKTKRDVELLVVAHAPKPDAPTVIRRVREIQPLGPPLADTADAIGSPPTRSAAATPGGPTPAEGCDAAVQESRYKIQFTASALFEAKLRRAQALLRHTLPDGSVARILERGLDLLLRDTERRRTGAADRPRSTSDRRAGRHARTIPAAVKREVWKRDSGRCAFVGTAGRCNEVGFLEFHHVVPFAHGGPATTFNIELRCRAHNSYEAEVMAPRPLVDAPAEGHSPRGE